MLHKLQEKGLHCIICNYCARDEKVGYIITIMVNWKNISFWLLICNALISADVDDGSILHKGEATFYGDGGIGHCGFTSVQPQYHGAMNHIDYDSASVCGTWVEITGPKGTVTAFIDDECPECAKGDIDLGPGTFEMIADRALGRAPISWRYVPAPIQGPVQYFWKDGTSQYHIELQVRNHRYGIVKLEIQTQTSEWFTVQREPYNFFKKYQGINGQPGPYNIRITDVFGDQLIDSMVTIQPEDVIEGKANFPERSSGAVTPLKYSEDVQSETSIQKVVFLDQKYSEYRFTKSARIYTITGRRTDGISIDNKGNVHFAGNYSRGMVLIDNMRHSRAGGNP